MSDTRRQFLRQVAVAGQAVAAQAAGQGAAPARAKPEAAPAHDMSAFPPHWTGQEQIAMLMYPGFTALA